MFYPWLVDKGAATCVPEEECRAPLSRDNALPSYDTAIDAIWLFPAYSRRVRPLSICRLTHF
jgi:hypothetical protein